MVGKSEESEELRHDAVVDMVQDGSESFNDRKTSRRSARLSIAGDRVRFIVKEGTNFAIERRQVLLCPRELKPNSLRWLAL